MVNLFTRTIKQVGQRLRAEGFEVLEGELASVSQVVWVRSARWKRFVDTARNQGVNLIVLTETKTPPRSCPDLSVDASIRRQLQKHSKQICELALAWAKEGVVYGLKISAPWWLKIKSRLGSAELQGRHVKAQLESEDHTIRSLLPRIVKRARTNRDSKITQADIRRHLEREGISLPYHSLRELWKQAKTRLLIDHGSSRNTAQLKKNRKRR